MMTHDEGYVLPPNHPAFISKSYDELIAYIDDSTNGLKHEHLFEKLLANTKALRAVVELHKPSIRNNGDTCECDVYDEYMMGYPCDTIQAIEKELG